MPPKKGQRHSGQFKPGQSGNPGGFHAEFREARKDIAKKLEEAYTEEGVDILVEAIITGTKKLIPPIVTLGAHYRWGKPKDRVEIEVPDRQRKEMIPALEAVLAKLKNETDEE